MDTGFAHLLHQLKHAGIVISKIELCFVVPVARREKFTPTRDVQWFETNVTAVVYPNANSRQIDVMTALGMRSTMRQTEYLTEDSVETLLSIVGVDYKESDSVARPGESVSSLPYGT